MKQLLGILDAFHKPVFMKYKSDCISSPCSEYISCITVIIAYLHLLFLGNYTCVIIIVVQNLLLI